MREFYNSLILNEILFTWFYTCSIGITTTPQNAYIIPKKFRSNYTITSKIAKALIH